MLLQHEKSGIHLNFRQSVDGNLSPSRLPVSIYRETEKEKSPKKKKEIDLNYARKL